MESTTANDIVDAVRGMNDRLIANGWDRINPFEVASPDRRLWFGTNFVTGEYTVHASHRAKGFGAARGNIRVRITPTLISNHPELTTLLVDDLIGAQITVDEDGFDGLVWPPPHWSELSVQGVVDHR